MPPGLLLVGQVRMGYVPNAASKATAAVSKDWTPLFPCTQRASHALTANQHTSLDAKLSLDGDGTSVRLSFTSQGCPARRAGMEGLFQAAAAALQTAQRPVCLS